MGASASSSALEPWINLAEAKGLAGAPYAVSARYHTEGGRVLADDYNASRRRLGKGRTGAVTFAISDIDSQKYAVKRFIKRELSLQQQEALARGATIHLAMDHPNVLKICDVYDSAEELVLVMECCAGGSLFNKVLKPAMLAEPDAAVATRQILRAVAYLHSHYVLHRDVRLEHLLYESKEADAPLKLKGFNAARTWNPAEPKLQTQCSSLHKLSPDMLLPEGYTSKCDVWSVGVIVFKLLTGYMPFSWDGTAMTFAILESKASWRGRDRFRVSAEALNFAKALLAENPECRPEADTALGHPWLARLADAEAPRLSKQVVQSMHEYVGASWQRRASAQLLARELLPEEVRELREIFFRLDTTGSGSITSREFADAFLDLKRERGDAPLGLRCLSNTSTADTEGLSALSPSAQSPLGSERGGRSPPGSVPVIAAPAGARIQWGQGGLSADLAQASTLFQALDGNGNGEVYWSDFLAAGLGSLQLRDQAVQRALARFDDD